MNRRTLFRSLPFIGTSTAATMRQPVPATGTVLVNRCSCGMDFWSERDPITYAQMISCLNPSCGRYMKWMLPPSLPLVEAPADVAARIDERLRLEAQARATLEKIECYKRAWEARMSMGHYGRITPDEEGNRYGEGVIRNGKMVLEA